MKRRFSGSLIIYGGMTVNNATSTETYELNLNTLAWSRRKTIATQVNRNIICRSVIIIQEIRTQLSEIAECLDADNLLVGDRMHIIGRSIHEHFVSLRFIFFSISNYRCSISQRTSGRGYQFTMII